MLDKFEPLEISFTVIILVMIVTFTISYNNIDVIDPPTDLQIQEIAQACIKVNKEPRIFYNGTRLVMECKDL